MTIDYHYRIEFSIQRSRDDWATVEEIDYGSSLDCDTISEALHDMESSVQNYYLESDPESGEHDDD